MARATKVLTNINEEITISDVDELNGAASIQYGAGGLGTLVLEVSCQDNGAAPPVDDWVQIKIFNPAIAVNAAVDNLAAAGYAWAEVVGVKKVRVRKSVAGAGPVRATLTINND